MNKIDKFKVIGLLIIVCISLFSCGYSKKDAKKYLPGIYSYEIPSGELQVLKINSDFTFKQVIYSKSERNILYENRGKMYVSGGKIEFEHWLECYELGENKMSLRPRITYYSGVFWRKPAGNDNVLIVMFDQTNYIFEKVK